jgi:radical SAM protein with 4Fe4S-binding SPASM domain
LLVIERCAPALRRLAEAGVVMFLNSTMAVLTPELATILKDLGISSALVSIPSFDPHTDALITNSASSWRSTAAGVGIALKAGIHIEANMVVCRHNIDQIFETAKYVKNLGVTHFAATKMSHPSSEESLGDVMLSAEQFQFMASELKRIKAELGLNVDTVQAYAYCGIADDNLRVELPIFNKTCSAARTFCMIAPNGAVRPCPLVSDIYGNALDDAGLVGAWQKMRDWRDDSMLPKQCRDCSHKATCAGGCKADAKHANGSYGRPDPYCNFTHATVIPKVRIEIKELKSSYCLNPKVQFRPESFGGIAYVRGAKWCPMDHRLFSALQKTGANYTTTDFARDLETEVVEANRTMNFLVRKGVLIESNN